MDPLSARIQAEALLASKPVAALSQQALAAQQANRTAHLRRLRQLEELKREVVPKVVGVRTSWAKGQGPLLPKV